MNKCTIEYRYATYSSTKYVWADDEEQAVAKLWQDFSEYMEPLMKHKSDKIIDVVYAAYAVFLTV